MAKATAHCTCRKCGKEFVKTHTCQNRTDADSWESWAENHFNLCGACWYKEQQEEENAAGLKVKMRLGSPYSTEREMWFVLYGDTFSIKDKLKAIGSIWTDCYPGEDWKFAGGMLAGLTGRPQSKRWVICCALENADEIKEKTDALTDLGFSFDEGIDEMELQSWVAARREIERMRKEKEDKQAQAAAEKKEKLEAELSALGPIPPWPDSFPPAGKWNEKIYGKAGNRNIYIDGDNYVLTDELAENVEKTMAARSAWRSQKAAIQEKYK